MSGISISAVSILGHPLEKGTRVIIVFKSRLFLRAQQFSSFKNYKMIIILIHTQALLIPSNMKHCTHKRITVTELYSNIPAEDR